MTFQFSQLPYKLKLNLVKGETACPCSRYSVDVLTWNYTCLAPLQPRQIVYQLWVKQAEMSINLISMIENVLELMDDEYDEMEGKSITAATKR